MDESSTEVDEWVVCECECECVKSLTSNPRGPICIINFYLLLLSFAADADTRCHEACTKALEFAPDNPEAYQIQASCLLSQEKTEEAKSSLIKSVSLWLPTNDTEGGASDVTMTSSENDVPPYGSRLNTAKLLLELREFEVRSIKIMSLTHAV